MRDRLVVWPDGTSRRMPAEDASAFAARAARGDLQVLDIAWDGRRGGPGGPYLSTDLHETRPAPGRDYRAEPRNRRGLLSR